LVLLAETTLTAVRAAVGDAAYSAKTEIWLGDYRSRFCPKANNCSRLDQYEKPGYRQKYRHSSFLGTARICCPGKMASTESIQTCDLCFVADYSC
jgi:hypothetical protein